MTYDMNIRVDNILLLQLTQKKLYKKDIQTINV